MPDWFYRTIARPVLFRMPVRTSRFFALGLLGTVARVPGGKYLIDFLGHMRSDERLAKTILNLQFPSPIGIGWALDEKGKALKALERFGIGFLEYGPITLDSQQGHWQRRPEEEAIWISEPPPSRSLETAKRQLSKLYPMNVPLLVRVGALPWSSPEEATLEVQQIISDLDELADGFIVTTSANALGSGWSDESWALHLQTISSGFQHAGNAQPLWISIHADTKPEDAFRLLAPAEEWGYSGIVIDSSLAAGPTGRVLGVPAREAALNMLRYLRQQLGPMHCMMISSGVHQPEDALAMIESGADLVSADTGIVYSGPGLPKRTNELLLATQLAEMEANTTSTISDQETATLPDLNTLTTFDPATNEEQKAEPAAPRGPSLSPPVQEYLRQMVQAQTRPAAQSWFWLLLMGIGLTLGGILSIVIGLTKVVLPYDETFVGITRQILHEVNPQLLHFMAHDRISLAGAMLATGLLYIALSWFGIRKGLHWARVTVLCSAWVGFASFLSFLGFGYFDPFHAFVTTILFQFLLMGCYAHCLNKPLMMTASPRETAGWRRAQWGQLLLLIHAAGLIIGGVVITILGCTTVLVKEDLAFLNLTPHSLELLEGAYPNLLPLIAHDRATFGSMLAVLGLCFLLPTLWGIRGGTKWLWWAMLLCGMLAYLTSWGVHAWVHYNDWFHLLPLTGGLSLLLLGLGLTYRYQCRE